MDAILLSISVACLVFSLGGGIVWSLMWFVNKALEKMEMGGWW